MAGMIIVCLWNIIHRVSHCKHVVLYMNINIFGSNLVIIIIWGNDAIEELWFDTMPLHSSHLESGSHAKYKNSTMV